MYLIEFGIASSHTPGKVHQTPVDPGPWLVLLQLVAPSASSGKDLFEMRS